MMTCARMHAYGSMFRLPYLAPICATAAGATLENKRRRGFRLRTEDLNFGR